MAMINNTQYSLADAFWTVKRRKNTFLQRVDKLIDWKIIRDTLKAYYPKGKATLGRRAYDPLVLFKMTLLQTWYDLSDYQLEEQLEDRASFREFCQIPLAEQVPDHSVVCRFRKALTQADAYQHLLDVINQELAKRQLLVKQGAIVDASITPTPRKPKGKKVCQGSENLDAETSIEPSEQSGEDKQGSWVKKGARLFYGYKRHYLAEDQSGLVLAVSTTPAHEHESRHLEGLLEKVALAQGSELLADRGYCSAGNSALLSAKGLKDRIQRKQLKGHKRNPWISKYNKLIGKRRYKIERVFGSIKRWFKSGVARYVGLAKTHAQHVLEAISYNLYRAPGLALSAMMG